MWEKFHKNTSDGSSEKWEPEDNGMAFLKRWEGEKKELS